MDPLHTDMQVLADQQELPQLSTDRGCRLEDLPEAMEDRDE